MAVVVLRLVRAQVLPVGDPVPVVVVVRNPVLVLVAVEIFGGVRGAVQGVGNPVAVVVRFGAAVAVGESVPILRDGRAMVLAIGDPVTVAVAAPEGELARDRDAHQPLGIGGIPVGGRIVVGDAHQVFAVQGPTLDQSPAQPGADGGQLLLFGDVGMIQEPVPGILEPQAGGGPAEFESGPQAGQVVAPGADFRIGGRIALRPGLEAMAAHAVAGVLGLVPGPSVMQVDPHLRDVRVLPEPKGQRPARPRGEDPLGQAAALAAHRKVAAVAQGGVKTPAPEGPAGGHLPGTVPRSGTGFGDPGPAAGPGPPGNLQPRVEPGEDPRFGLQEHILLGNPLELAVQLVDRIVGAHPEAEAAQAVRRQQARMDPTEGQGVLVLGWIDGGRVVRQTDRPGPGGRAGQQQGQGRGSHQSVQGDP